MTQQNAEVGEVGGRKGGLALIRLSTARHVHLGKVLYLKYLTLGMVKKLLYFIASKSTLR